MRTGQAFQRAKLLTLGALIATAGSPATAVLPPPGKSKSKLSPPASISVT